MLRKKYLVTMVAVAITSFLIGATFNISVLAMDVDGNPFSKIWQAIYNLQERLEDIEESLKGTSNADIERFVNEMSRVELLRASGGENGGYYYYYYGVSGHWNITRMQQEPIVEELNSTIDGAMMYCDAYDNTYYSMKPEYKGYERLVMMAVNRELNPTEIEEVRLLIREYLAHL